MVLSGILQLDVEDRNLSLYPGDIALLHAGLTRQVSAEDRGTRAVVVRENEANED